MHMLEAMARINLTFDRSDGTFCVGNFGVVMVGVKPSMPPKTLRRHARICRTPAAVLPPCQLPHYIFLFIPSALADNNLELSLQLQLMSKHAITSNPVLLLLPA